MWGSAVNLQVQYDYSIPPVGKTVIPKEVPVQLGSVFIWVPQKQPEERAWVLLMYLGGKPMELSEVERVRDRLGRRGWTRKMHVIELMALVDNWV